MSARPDEIDDAEFERQMALAREVMHENRRILAALAEYDRTGAMPTIEDQSQKLGKSD